MLETGGRTRSKRRKKVGEMEVLGGLNCQARGFCGHEPKLPAGPREDHEGPEANPCLVPVRLEHVPVYIESGRCKCTVPRSLLQRAPRCIAFHTPMAAVMHPPDITRLLGVPGVRIISQGYKSGRPRLQPGWQSCARLHAQLATPAGSSRNHARHNRL